MSEELCILNGGIQTVIPQQAAPQLVYLDFDGASTSYVNADLGVSIDNVTVEDSGFMDGDIAVIVDALNGMFADVAFTSELPADGEFSTIYIGVTSAFDEYGSFLGLAETIDSGNQIRDDNAFVLLDSSADAELVVSVIAHETEHIVYGMDHGGEGLERFAAHTYIVDSGQVSEGVTLDYGATMYVNYGGMATNTYVQEGNIIVSSGGVANGTTLERVYGLGPNLTPVLKDANMFVYSGGIITGFLILKNGANITAYDGSILDFDISTLSPGNSSLVNVFTLVLGNPSYTLTVSDSQTEGTYNLARSVAIFNSTITVVNNVGTELDTLTVGEDAKRIGKAKYSLALNGGNLTVTVVGITIFTGDLTSEKDITDGMLASDVNVHDGGKLYIFTGGVAEDTALNYYGDMYVSNGGEAYRTTVNQQGRLSVSSGGMAKSTTLTSGGFVYVESDGKANGVTVEGGKLIVSDCGTVDGLTLGNGGEIRVSSGGKMTGRMVFEEGAYVYAYDGSVLDFDIAEATAVSPLVSNLSAVWYKPWEDFTWNNPPNLTLTVSDTQAGGLYFLADGAAGFDRSITVVNPLGEGFATLTVGGGTVQINGKESMLILDDDELRLAIGVFTGTLNNETKDVKEMYASGVVVNAGGVLNVLDGGTAEKTAVNSMGRIFVCSGGVAEDTAVNRGGTMCVANGIVKGSNDVAPSATLKVAGPMTIADGAVVIAYNGSVIDFDITALSPDDAPLVNDLSRINGAPSYTVTVTAEQEKGDYILADDPADFTGSMTVKCAGAADVTVTVGDAYVAGADQAYSLVVTDGQLVFSVMELDTTPPDAPELTLSGDAASKKLVVTALWDTDDAVCLYAVDGSQSLQKYDKPLSFANDTSVRLLTRDAASNETDRSLDLLFGRATGKWGKGYSAWNPNGYDDAVELKGRNVIGGVFSGSDDSTILVLTDDKNGDALFLDDIYSAYPDGTSAQKRLSKVNEIFAGAGNDIVDLTSPRFDYADKGVMVHGGDGNDVIWANSGANTLYGDAGDDRIVGGSGDDVIVGGAGNDTLHGGGGNDIFCFCGDWGKDTVEQLATGTVTLWFEEKFEGEWNEATHTFTYGDNSITLVGVNQASIFFGNVDNYDELLAAGAFDAFTSDKIFGGNGIALA